MAKSKSKKADETKANPEVEETVTREIMEGMKHEELVLFARLNYPGFGNVTTKSYPKGELIELIMKSARAYKGNAQMKVVEMNEEVEVPPGYVKIRVSPGDYNPNHRPVVVGLNFKMATIPCNKDVVMHEKWLPCLQDAVQTRYYVDRSDPKNEKLGAMEQHSYPFSILERG